MAFREAVQLTVDEAVRLSPMPLGAVTRLFALTLAPAASTAGGRNGQNVPVWDGFLGHTEVEDDGSTVECSD